MVEQRTQRKLRLKLLKDPLQEPVGQSAISGTTRGSNPLGGAILTTSDRFFRPKESLPSPLRQKFLHPIHHFQIQVSDIRKSARFYGELLPRLGFLKVFETKGMVEWQAEGTRIIIAQVAGTYLASGFHRKRTGLNHIAFRAISREAVDDLYRNYLVPSNIPILYGGAREWPDYDPGYYAVYFEDPDRIKLEVVYVSGDM